MFASDWKPRNRHRTGHLPLAICLRMCRSRVDACLESLRFAETLLLPNSATPIWFLPKVLRTSRATISGAFRVRSRSKAVTGCSSEHVSGTAIFLLTIPDMFQSRVLYDLLCSALVCSALRVRGHLFMRCLIVPRYLKLC